MNRFFFWNAPELEELHTERRTLQETADAARTRGWQHEADLNSARETLTALQDSQARERTERRDQAAQETAHRRDEARQAHGTVRATGGGRHGGYADGGVHGTH